MKIYDYPSPQFMMLQIERVLARYRALEEDTEFDSSDGFARVFNHMTEQYEYLTDFRRSLVNEMGFAYGQYKDADQYRDLLRAYALAEMIKEKE